MEGIKINSSQMLKIGGIVVYDYRHDSWLKFEYNQKDEIQAHWCS